MPKTTILPANQRGLFQSEGFSKIFDLSAVQPLFKVLSVVLIRQRNKAHLSDIPLTYFDGTLPYKNVGLPVAENILRCLPSCLVNPKPFVSLNHFTVPRAMGHPPFRIAAWCRQDRVSLAPLIPPMSWAPALLDCALYDRSSRSSRSRKFAFGEGAPADHGSGGTTFALD
jgi:hypothetical protein